jgi:hypothetical protein
MSASLSVGQSETVEQKQIRFFLRVNNDDDNEGMMMVSMVTLRLWMKILYMQNMLLFSYWRGRPFIEGPAGMRR